MNYIEVGPCIEEVLAQHSEVRCIPNKYVATILGLSNLELNEDGYHYTRPLGPDHERYTKSIYSIPSEEILQNLVRQTIWQECLDIKFCYDELIKWKEVDNLDGIHTLGMAVIGNFDELYSVCEAKEIPIATIEQLQETLELLTSNFPDDKSIQRAVSYGHKILDIVQPLEFLPYHEDIEPDNSLL